MNDIGMVFMNIVFFVILANSFASKLIYCPQTQRSDELGDSPSSELRRRSGDGPV